VKVFPHEFKRVLRKSVQHETVARHAVAGSRPIGINVVNR
jgi:hypothetical protein